MIRMFGALLLAAGAILLGCAADRHLKRRVVELQDLIQGLSTILRELEYRAAPLPDLLGVAAVHTSGQASAFFQLCAQSAEHLNGRTFQEVWRQTMEAVQLRLEQADLTILAQLGTFLGRYDTEGQRKMLENTIAQMETQRLSAQEQSVRMGKVYRVLSLTGGAFVLILMI